MKRFEKGRSASPEGPFAIPAESRLDGGASEEWMWMQVTSCDPKGFAGFYRTARPMPTNLFGPERPCRWSREKSADWLLRLPDGGTAGGESIKALQKRR